MQCARTRGASLLCGLLVLAAGGVARAQQVPCPSLATPGTASAANCAAAAKTVPGSAGGSGGGSGYALDNNWSLSGSAGTSRGLVTSGPLGRNGREGVDRNYAGAHLSGSYWFGRSLLDTRLSVIQGEEKLGGFGLGTAYGPDARNNLSQAAATARYSYWFDGFMPYASVTVASDLARSTNPAFPSLGRGAWIPRVGVDFFSQRGFSGGIAYSAEQGSAVKNQVWSANMNYRF